MRSDTLERSITSRQLVSFLAQFLPPLFFLSLSLLNFFFFHRVFYIWFCVTFSSCSPLSLVANSKRGEATNRNDIEGRGN